MLVAGRGLVCPFGTSVPRVVDALALGTPLPVETVARTRAGRDIRVARAPDPDLTLHAPKLEKYLSRDVALGVSAAKQAWAEANLEGRVAPERIGVYAATGHTGLEADTFFGALSAAWPLGVAGPFDAVGGRPLRLVDPYFSLRTLANGLVAFTSLELGALGPSVLHVHSPVAGLAALQGAMDDLALGRCDAAIVVASDSLLAPTVVMLQERAGVLDDEEAGVLAEGAAALVLRREGEATSSCGQVAWCELAGGDGALLPGLAALSGASADRAQRTWATSADRTTASPLVRACEVAGVAGVEARHELGNLGAAAALAWVVLATTEAGRADGTLVVTQDGDGAAAAALVRPAHLAC